MPALSVSFSSLSFFGNLKVGLFKAVLLIELWFWNTVLKEAILKEPRKKSLAAYMKKETVYKVHIYGWDLTCTTERKGRGSLSSLAAWPKHLGISLPHIHYFIYCPNLIFHDFPDSEGWQLLSTVQRVCSTHVNNYTICWSFLLKGVLSKISNLDKSRSYRCEWNWNPRVLLFFYPQKEATSWGLNVNKAFIPFGTFWELQTGTRSLESCHQIVAAIVYAVTCQGPSDNIKLWFLHFSQPNQFIF